MHALLAALPIGGGANAALVDASLIAQQLAHCAHERSLARGPHVSLAVGKIRSAQREQEIAARVRGLAAVAPLHIQIGACIEFDSRGGIGDFEQRRHARAGRKLLQATGDGGQRGLVAYQQMPVEPRRNDERAARPADAEVVPGAAFAAHAVAGPAS